MNPRTKILLMSSTKKDRYHDDYDDPRSERSGTRVRRRDGTYIPVYPSMNYGHEIESKFRDRRGREHYDDGRYAPMSEYGRRSIEPSLHYPMYEEEYGERPIGFRMEHDRGRDRDMDMRYPYIPRPYDPYMGMVDPYMADTPYVGDRTYHHKNMGHAASMDKGKLTHEEAEQWMRTIKNADGKTGAHWTKEQAQQVQQQQGIDCDPLEFWVAINMIYSDFYRVAKECNCNTIQFYSAMAEAFLDDSDARPDKLRRYYDHIVKHQ